MKKRGQLRVAGYIRVSDESQIDGHSLAAQRKEIERWCKQRGYLLVKIYAEEGKSAHTDRIERRPVLITLLQDAEAGLFDIVVVHNIDRWSRNVGVQRQALQRLGSAKVGFASVSEDIDFTTSTGRLLLTTMGGVAEFFSDQLGFHVSKAQRDRAESGLPVGPIPFGYRTDQPGGIPVLVEDESQAVHEVFERRARGESNGSIASWLNDQRFRTRKGRVFTGHTIKDMLRCRFYLGKIVYGREEFVGQHTAVISVELFDRVQLRRQRRSITRRVDGPKGLLQGMLSCGNCGSPIQSDRHRYDAPMYRERHSLECETNGRSIMAYKFDAQIAAILQSVELNPDWQRRIVRLTLQGKEGPNPKEFLAKRKRISRAYAEGAFTDAEFEEKLAEIDDLLARTPVTDLPTLEEAAALFQNIPALWMEATLQERRQLLTPLIERVYVDLESKLIGAIVPVAAFRTVLVAAMQRTDCSDVLLLTEKELERNQVWSWWRRGRVELPVQTRYSSDRAKSKIEQLYLIELS